MFRSILGSRSILYTLIAVKVHSTKNVFIPGRIMIVYARNCWLTGNCNCAKLQRDTSRSIHCLGIRSRLRQTQILICFNFPALSAKKIRWLSAHYRRSNILHWMLSLLVDMNLILNQARDFKVNIAH